MYLDIEATIIATPFIDPALSKVTELLMNKKIAENPMEAIPLIENAMTTSKPHRSHLLQNI